MSVQFLCKDCVQYNSCEYYHNRKKDSHICKFFHLQEKDKYKKIYDRLYTRLNDMRVAIAPDEYVTDENERNDRLLQIDLIDEIMECMLEQEGNNEIL